MGKQSWGPWEATADINMEKRTEAAVWGSDGDLVAYIDSGYEGCDYVESIDRARLIAAAPELLEACKAVVRWAEVFGPITSENIEPFIQQCGAAIAKAEGRE